MDNAEVSTAAELEELKTTVGLRDKMGGALYYNMLNDECCRIANKCLEAGCDRTEIEQILGKGNFTYYKEGKM